MTKEEFQARWRQIEEQEVATRAAVSAKFDQAKAKLLVESGWTQERIAAEIKTSQQHVQRLLLFGRFLDYTHGCNSGGTPVSGLTERTFRQAWGKTRRDSADRDSEKHRFGEVMAILQAQFQLGGTGAVLHRKQHRAVSQLLAQRYAEKGWTPTSKILEECASEGVDETRLKDGLKTIKDRHAAGCWIEKKQVGKEVMVRIRKMPKKKALDAVTVTRFYEEAMEHLKELEKLPKVHITTFSVASVVRHTQLLMRLVKGLYEEIEK